MASTTRITGMYSGMDTDALIEELISANKTPLNNYQREKTEVEWQRETLIDLNKQLLELQNISKDMQSEASFKAFTTQSTNTRIATATATTDAVEGTYTIVTEQLATATTYTSSPVSQNNNNIARIANSSSVRNFDYSNTSFNVTLNGVTKTISFGADEGVYDKYDDYEAVMQADFQKKLDDAFGANQIEVKISADGTKYDIGFSCHENALDLPLVVTSGPDGADALGKMKIESGASNVFNTNMTIGELAPSVGSEVTIKINGYTETFSADTTITDLFKKINSSDAGINVKYDSLSDAIIMRRTDTGAGREIEIDDGGTGLFNSLGFGSLATYTSGTNAKVSITDPEGRTRTGLEIPSNSFTYEGVNFNLTKAVPDEEVSITVAKDVDTVFDNVVKFVDKYNEVLGKLNELYNEKPNRDYDPLLDEERDELTDTQQEKWDKLARQGILYRDSTLQSTIATMRDSVTSLVTNNSNMSSLFQIGISTTAYSSTGSDNGKLVIDEEKLREAIANDMEGVSALFTNKPDYISGKVIDTATTTIAQGSSFKITVNGKTETITFDKDYDLSDATQKSEMISNINSVLTSKFGSKNIVFALSDDRLLVTSQKGHSITLNSGDGVDALASLGIDDGETYDATQLGFSNKIYNIMASTMSTISDKAGSNATALDESSLGERMKKINDYISRQQDRLERLEDRYYSQFAAMESALAQMESQSSYLTSMLSGSGM